MKNPMKSQSDRGRQNIKQLSSRIETLYRLTNMSEGIRKGESGADVETTTRDGCGQADAP
jgi:hypothetical protein